MAMALAGVRSPLPFHGNHRAFRGRTPVPKPLDRSCTLYFQYSLPCFQSGNKLTDPVTGSHPRTRQVNHHFFFTNYKYSLSWTSSIAAHPFRHGGTLKISRMFRKQKSKNTAVKKIQLNFQGTYGSTVAASRCRSARRRRLSSVVAPPHRRHYL